MAIIKLYIEDLPQSKVRVVCEPNFEQLMKVAKYGTLTNAESYALLALTTIHRAGKKASGPAKSKIWRPS
jgi:hypothetical protein